VQTLDNKVEATMPAFEVGDLMPVLPPLLPSPLHKINSCFAKKKFNTRSIE